MALRFQPPSFVRPLEYEGIANLPRGLDEILDAHLRRKALEEQQRAAAEDRRFAGFQRTMAFGGVDPATMSPEAIRSAFAPQPTGPVATPAPGPFPTAGPAGPTISAPAPSNNLVPVPGGPDTMDVALLQQFLEKQGKTAALASLRQMAGVRKDTAQAGLYEAQADALRRGDIYFDPVSGRQVAVPPGAKPLPKPDRPATTEYTARGYADKAKQADVVLQGLVQAGFDPASVRTGFGGLAPNILKPGNVQQSEQALRQFVNAILRRESGAAIPPAELDNYRKQYWPQTGDSAGTLTQKAEARRLAIAGLETEAERVPSSLPAGSTLKPGTVEDGYRYKGGDPASPTSWERVQ